MSFGFVAFHYPAPEDVEEFIEGCHQVIEVGRSRPGLLHAEVWVTPGGDAVVTTAAFESREAFAAAAEATASMTADDSREVKPRQVHFLQSR